MPPAAATANLRFADDDQMTSMPSVTLWSDWMVVKTPIFCKLLVKFDSHDSTHASVPPHLERQRHDVVFVDPLAKIERFPAGDPESESEIEADRP